MEKESFAEKHVELHFQDKTKLLKERLETKSAFEFLHTTKSVELVNLACGNFIDAKIFSQSFSHPSSKLYGLDKTLYQLAQSYHQNHFLDLVQFDLFEETSQLKEFLETKTHWLAIHACKELAFQILRLWNEWAPSDSCLLLVPCCHFSKKQAIAEVGYEEWNKIRLETKNQINHGKNHKVDYMNIALITLRNNLLQKKSKWFCRTVQLNIPSIHSLGLYYVKNS